MIARLCLEVDDKNDLSVTIEGSYPDLSVLAAIVIKDIAAMTGVSPDMVLHEVGETLINII